MDRPSVPPRGEPRLLWGRVVGVAVVSALAYAGFAAWGDAREFLVQFGRLRLETLVLALSLVTIGFAWRAMRWHQYLWALGSPVSPGTSFLTFVSGFAMGVTPGKLGELVKAHYLAVRTGAPYRHSFAAIVAERVTDSLALVLLLLVGLTAFPGIGLGPVIGLAVIAVVGVLFLRSPKVAPFILVRTARLRFLARVSRALADLHGELRRLLRFRSLLPGTALGTIAWSLEVTGMMVLAQGFGLGLSWAACAFIFTAGSLLGFLTMLPGGLGATEGGMVALMTLQGIPLPAAAALTIAMRLCTLWWSVLLGGLAIVTLRGTTTRALNIRPGLELPNEP